MRFEINIDYSPEKMDLSRKRIDARNDFRYVDRVPVNYCVVPRYFAPMFRLRYLDFFKDAETQYYWLLQFAKYQIENIPSDFCTEPTIYIHPYFDNVVPPSGQGAEIGWTEESPPRAIPVIHTIEAMNRFEVARPDAGLRGKVIEWWQQMKEFITQTSITFYGQEGTVEMTPLGVATNRLSPHMIAIDLVGEDFYWWMLEYPEACHRFLSKITRGEIDAENLVRQIDPQPRGEYFSLGEDSAQVMSARLFKEFCLPYTNAMFEEFGRGLEFGRGIHMCGDSTHLHQVLRDDLKMTHFDIFGYLVPPKVAAANLGGHILLWGNINPMLMQEGTKEEVKKAALECLEAMAPCGGFMLGDGANVCPGTPLQSFQAIMEAAEEYGLGGGKLKT
jgi:uroporphyrinogen-III decarboxylase